MAKKRAKKKAKKKVAKKIQGKTFVKTVVFSKDKVTMHATVWDAYGRHSLSHDEYNILKKWDCGVWLNLFIVACLGICLENAFKVIAFMWKKVNSESQEQVKELIENQGQVYEMNKCILLWTCIAFVVLLFFNKIIRNPRKTLLKKIGLEIKGSQSTIQLPEGE